MGKKLAILGHSACGKEVIEILKMMGGENSLVVSGYEPFNLYYINDNRVINYKHHSLDKGMIIFTLEEFLEKFPFKVGDFVRIPEYESEVRILKMKWCPVSEHIEYLVCPNDEDEWFTADELLEDNDNPLKDNNNPTNVSKMKNVLAELLEHIKTTPKEELEREFEEIAEWSNVGPTVEEFRAFCKCVNKKPVYPKTYVECCKITEDVADASLTCFACNLLNNFQKLLLCRDAYWEIAGEEMGLGKQWEPDWTSGYPVYCISVSVNTIGTGKWYTDNKILAFPTEEMRDAFYDNFKDLIESCKELL